MAIDVLEICPYEPPVSGWVNRVKLLREVIRDRGGRCEILDVGPSRKIERPECISVQDGWDYLAKIYRFARQGFTFHCHINAEYFRGLLLNFSALLLGRTFGNRCVTTFHGGPVQIFLSGWRRWVLDPLFRGVFSISHAVVCNSEDVKIALLPFSKADKIFPIPAFSSQYLKFQRMTLSPELARFMEDHSPVVSTYLCFRPGFYTDVLLDAVERLILTFPRFGHVIVGTGAGLPQFEGEVARRRLSKNILLAGDLDHDSFMTILSRSDVHLRTHVADGVSSTILEALSLRIPSVASENGTRPRSVHTYRADDAAELAAKVAWTVDNHDAAVAALEPPDVADTASVEVDLLIGPARPQAAGQLQAR